MRFPLFAFVRRTLRFAVPIAWGLGIVAALYSLEHYKSLAGRAAAMQAAPPPVDLSAPARMRLVMYVHPHCPCTRASLAEFKQLVDAAKTEGKVLRPEIVVVVPPGIDDSWREGAIVRAAEKLVAEKSAEVTLRFNHDFVEIFDVGATTSGHTLLIAADGRQLFRGGLTRSRGHAGDNPGTRAIADLLHDRKPETGNTPVFGCPLIADDACRSPAGCRFDAPLKFDSPVTTDSLAPVTKAQD